MTYNTDHVQPGAVLFNGKIMPEGLRQTYNQISDRIKSFQDTGRRVPEHIVNGRHNLMASFIHATFNKQNK